MCKDIVPPEVWQLLESHASDAADDRGVYPAVFVRLINQPKPYPALEEAFREASNPNETLTPTA